jgi:AraC-like DNA-binding protein
MDAAVQQQTPRHEDRVPATRPATTNAELAPSVARQVLRALADAVERAGGARSNYLQTIALREADLSSAEARLTFDQAIWLSVQARLVARDQAFALHWGERLDARSFGPVSHLVEHAGSLRHGFALIAQFESLFVDRRTYSLTEQGNSFTIEVLDFCDFGGVDGKSVVSEAILSCMLTIVRSFAPCALPKLATFAYPAPRYRWAYERIFGDVRFEQAASKLVFDRALLDKPSPHRDPDMHSAMRTVAEQRLARMREAVPLALRLRELLLERAPHRCTAEEASRALGVGARTLRRHLAAEGTSFRAVELGALGMIAKQYLCDQHCTIKETAERMGFSGPATFHRAFKSWTGLTPTDFRTAVTTSARRSELTRGATAKP